MLQPTELPLCLSGTPEQDRDLFCTYVAQREDLSRALPRRSRRSEGQRRLADQAHASCRAARRLFMHTHGDWVYRCLTVDLTSRKRLDELVFDAAALIDGLVPTREQIAVERECAQKDKEGREIDQGIFFWGVLRCARSGTHLLDSMLLPTTRAQALLQSYLQCGRADLGPILLERHESAAHLTIRNLATLNAEDDALVEAMETAVDLALMDHTSVCVLRGAPMTHPRYRGRRVLCPGINLRHLAAGKISFVNFLLRRELGVLNKIRRGIFQPMAELALQDPTCKPWIVAVESFAIGGGMQILLNADRVIAADDSYLSLPAAHEGIIPGAANLRLGRLVGGRLARQIVLSGRKLHALDAEAAALIDRVVPVGGMDTAIKEAVAELSAPAVIANRMMINLHEETSDTLRMYMADFALQQSLRLYAAEVIEKTWPPRRQARASC